MAGLAVPALAQDGFDDVVIFATNSAYLEQASDVHSGAVVVNDVSAGPTLASGTELTIGLATFVGADSLVIADSIKVKESAVVLGDVRCNELDDNSGAVTCSDRPVLPFFATLPPFKSEPAGTVDVTVALAGSAVLDPGDYRDVKVKHNGTLILSGGVYNLRNLDAGHATSLLFEAPSEVRIADKLILGQNSFLGPDSGASIGARDIVLYVAGVNGTSGALGATPKAATLGLATDVFANVYAPNGTLWIRQATIATGAFLARDVDLGLSAEVHLDSAFGNLPPSAHPQNLFTDGPGTLTLNLTGSDPNGDDLTFSIVTEPGAGTLGPLVEAPPPTPGTPPGCNPENDPACTPGDPARTSATITYTPNSGDDLADSFTFAVTDTAGLSGMAVVAINPDTSEAPPLPEVPLDTVLALDGVAETAVELATAIVLFAEAPCDGACDGVGDAPYDDDVPLTFTIIAGPSSGAVSPVNQGAETPRRSASVTYTPEEDFAGGDAFTFEACGAIDGLQVCDQGAVLITVTGELANDQEVTTPQEEPLLITLTGVPGAGSVESGGAALAPRRTAARSLSVDGARSAGAARSAGTTRVAASPRRIAQKAAFLAGAQIAGAVADSDDDGFGDNHNALPGAAPVVASAAVDASGGPGSNGTARFHIEWDISGFAGLASSLTSAEVILHTLKGTTDILDTFFFVGSHDGDGALDDDDFQTPATPVPGVVMPVPAGAVGSEGTFSFDVLPQLLAALSDDRAFFVVQGRVDEGLAGGGSQRGLQIRTSAQSNLDSFQQPHLGLTTPGVTAPPLVFTIVTLPEFGTLRDAFGTPITAVPTALTNPSVTYTPNPDYFGPDAFEFEAEDFSNISRGIISILVLEQIVDPCTAVGRPPGCEPGN
jgi:hypothetical protein